VGVVVLLIGAGAGEGELIALTVGVEVVVDELAPVVRVESQQAERQRLPYDFI
jgi:hypothetical protein